MEVYGTGYMPEKITDQINNQEQVHRGFRVQSLFSNTMDNMPIYMQQYMHVNNSDQQL